MRQIIYCLSSVVLAVNLIACGGNNNADSSVGNPNTQTGVDTQAPPHSSQSNISLSAKSLPLVEFPVPSVFEQNRAVALKALPGGEVVDVIDDFHAFQQSQWQVRFEHIKEQISGHFFASFNFTSLGNAQPFEHLIMSFSNSNSGYYLCQNCNKTEYRTTITGINPEAFGQSEGVVTVEVWGQTATDVIEKNIRLIGKKSFVWTKNRVVGLTVNRNQSNLTVAWQALTGEYDRYNVYLWKLNHDAEAELVAQKLAINQTQYQYNNLEDNGQYRVQVGAIDSHGESALSNMIELNNQAPTAINDSFSTQEDTLLSGNVLINDFDNENDSLSVIPEVNLTTANGGVVDIQLNGDFSYLPINNYFGKDSFSYTVKDSYGATSQANVEINVTPVNDPPIALANEFIANLGATDVFISFDDLLANDFDPDGDTLVITSEGLIEPSIGRITVQDGGFLYTAADFLTTEVHFSYQIKDLQGLTASAEVFIRPDTNVDTVIARNDSFNINEDAELKPDISVIDNDIFNHNQTIAISVVSQPSNGSLLFMEDGLFEYYPQPNFNGLDSFSYQIQKGDKTSQATVEINVIAVNDPPVGFDDHFRLDENSTLVIDSPGILANDIDIDGDDLTVLLETNVSHGTLELAQNGSFKYTPNSDFTGIDNFQYKLLDTGQLSTVVQVELQVESNASLVVEDDYFDVEASRVAFLTVLENDYDKNDAQLTITSASSENAYVYISENGELQYQSHFGFTGDDIVYYTVSNGVESADAMAYINVQPIYSLGQHDIDQDGLDDVTISFDQNSQIWTLQFAQHVDSVYSIVQAAESNNTAQKLSLINDVSTHANKQILSVKNGLFVEQLKGEQIATSSRYYLVMDGVRYYVELTDLSDTSHSELIIGDGELLPTLFTQDKVPHDLFELTPGDFSGFSIAGQAISLRLEQDGTGLIYTANQQLPINWIINQGALELTFAQPFSVNEVFKLSELAALELIGLDRAAELIKIIGDIDINTEILTNSAKVSIVENNDVFYELKTELTQEYNFSAYGLEQSDDFTSYVDSIWYVGDELAYQPINFTEESATWALPVINEDNQFVDDLFTFEDNGIAYTHILDTQLSWQQQSSAETVFYDDFERSWQLGVLFDREGIQYYRAVATLADGQVRNKIGLLREKNSNNLSLIDINKTPAYWSRGLLAQIEGGRYQGFVINGMEQVNMLANDESLKSFQVTSADEEELRFIQQAFANDDNEPGVCQSDTPYCFEQTVYSARLVNYDVEKQRIWFIEQVSVADYVTAYTDTTNIHYTHHKPQLVYYQMNDFPADMVFAKAPVVVDDFVQGDTRQVRSYDVLSNDSSAEENELSIILLEHVEGSLDIIDDKVVYTAEPKQTGVVVVDYWVTNEKSGFAHGTLNINFD